MQLQPTALSQSQWVKVLKALVYSFVSAFIFTVLAKPEINKSTLYAAGVAGINAALVAVKQLFTIGE